MNNNYLAKFLFQNFDYVNDELVNILGQNELSNLLIISVSDGYKRAKVITVELSDSELKNSEAIKSLLEKKLKWAAGKFKKPLKWLRLEWVTEEEQVSWGQLQLHFKQYKRNYFRTGIAFRGQTKPWCLLTEMELNGNACLYTGGDVVHAEVNQKNLETCFKARHGSKNIPDFTDDMDVVVFKAAGIFFDYENEEVHRLCTKPRNQGHRDVAQLSLDNTEDLITRTTEYLAKQVLKGGRFEYGHHPCFGRTINFYNTLRHASSVYSLIEGYQFCRNINDDSGKNTKKIQYIAKQIESALLYIEEKFIKHYDNEKAYLLEENNTIKLGANAVCILALVKYIQVFEGSSNNARFLKLAEQLSNGIIAMQKDNGKFVHVLDAETLDLVAENHVIYYDGEAVFGLMRLYGINKNEHLISSVEKAFNYFIDSGAGHNGAHDHWLSYAANEMVIYKPEKKYFQFAVNNVEGFTDFIRDRITTYPTLLELSMAFHKMLLKLEEHPEHKDVLNGLDVKEFYVALHARANYLVNGFFFPEMAMYYKLPDTILHGCFIRHHAFRVRIDDVQHYLSGWVAYHEMLVNSKKANKNVTQEHISLAQALPLKPIINTDENISTVAWGGDINLGRRQHFLTKKYGVENVLNIPVLQQSDYTIINLECVISVKGEQGRIKGEGGPFYYRARPEMTEVLQKVGVDVVACANNHSGDYGKVALLEQKEILIAAGIDSVGTGSNKQEAFSPTFHELPNGIKIALFSVDATMKHFAVTNDLPGAAYISPKIHNDWKEIYRPLFKKAKENADLVLVAIHWGDNGRDTPDADELKIGHILIDVGADAILGASAHQLQGVEVYQGKAIIHDAGDLLFDAIVPKPKLGGVFQLDLSRKGIECVKFCPVGVGYGQTTTLETSDAINSCREFAMKCIAMDTDINIHEDGSLSILLNPSIDEKPEKARELEENEFSKNKNTELDYSQWSADTRKDLVLDSVPDDAYVEPVNFGALQLVGIKTRHRFFNRRRMLWVESFWQINEAVNDDIRIHFRAKPTFTTEKMRPWGAGTEHDPCDWLIPTSRWEVGKVYRDWYGLRPPYMNAWEDGTLQLEVGVVTNDKESEFVPLPLEYVLFVKTLPYSDNLPEHMRYRQAFFDKIYENHTKGTWNAEQLASITNGKWLVLPPQNWFVDALVAGKAHVDMVSGNVMFVGNTNDNRAAHENSTVKPKPFDRHNQIAECQDKLVGAIVGHPVDGLKPDFPILQVQDPIKAWMEIGLAARTRFSKPIVAVTGTVGKSSSCDMIHTMLGEDKHILTSLDNYNSRVGVPGNLASLSPDHDAAIIEVAQSALWMQRGPITRFLRPDIALVTEIGLTQTKMVKSLEHAVNIKCRIFDGLSRNAIAVVGAHLPHFNQVLGYAKEHAKKVIIYGDHPQSVIRVKNISSDYYGSTIELETNRGNYTFTIPMPTEGMAKSAIAAFAVIYALGEDLEKACEFIGNYKAIEGRLQIYDIPVKDGIVTLVDDNWNAAFDSMVNAFSLFGDKKDEEKRLIYVLGRLVDMGEQAKEMHQKLAPSLLKSKPDLVITHGEEMKYLREALPADMLGEHFDNVNDLANYIKGLWKNNDVILIKGCSARSDFPLLSGLLRND